MGLERKGFFMPFVREQSGGTPQFTEHSGSYVLGDIYIFTTARTGTNMPATISSGATTILTKSFNFGSVTVTTIVAEATASTITFQNSVQPFSIIAVS